MMIASRLRRWFDAQGLAQRFALTAAVLAGGVIVLIGSTSWWYARNRLIERYETSLSQEAALAAEQVGGLLRAITNTMATVSRNSLLATALVDSAGKEIYLIPFLASFREVDGVPLDITFVDFEGKTIATSGSHPSDEADLQWLAGALHSGRSQATVRQGPDGAYLLVAELLVYTRTLSPEGALMYRLPLAALTPGSRIRLDFKDGGNGNKELVAVSPDGVFEASAAVKTTPILDPLGFRVTFVGADSSLVPSLRTIAWIFAAAGLAAVFSVLVLSRVAGSRLTRDLRHLQEFAALVVADGFSAMRVQVHGRDEVAQVATAVNFMLDRLAELYAEQEDQSRRRLEQERQRLADAQRIAHLGNGNLDLVTGRSEWSEEALRILGVTSSEVSTLEQVMGFIPEEDLGVVHAALAAPRPGLRLEHRVLRADGTLRHVATTIGDVALSPDGTPRAVTAVVQDVTERKMAEEQLAAKTNALEQSNAELEQFAYVASHDLRQPLRTVASFVGLLANECGDSLGPNANEYIGFALDGVRRMDRLIVDLLEYSRSGRGDRSGRVNLSEVMEDAVVNLRIAIEESAAAVEIQPGMPEIRGNAGELERLFQNLIGNALKYRRPDAAPRVAVTFAVDGDMVDVCVRDNGIGIAPQHHDRVFRIFQRLHARSEYEGTGIGLAICKKVVETHGGRIRIESAEGEGTAIFATLPLG
jgi:PAS domain S-box-containing protein